MEKIDGLVIDDLGFVPTYQGDLIFHEGPLLSHFVNADNTQEHYFYKWTDKSDEHHRWLVFKITTKDLTAFFQKKWTLLDLIKKNPFVYLIDYDTNIDPVKYQLCAIGAIPESYLPSEKSIFDDKRYDNYANQLKEEIVAQQEKEETLEIILQEIATIKLAQEKQNKVFNDFLQKVKPIPAKG